MQTTIKGGDIEVTIPEVFSPFDPSQPIRIYARNLPHWRQRGATYFVTFRLADSIPSAIWQEMCREAIEWKERIAREERLNQGALPVGLKSEYESFQHRHLSKVESVLDSGVGSCVLRDPVVRQIVSGALQFFNSQRYHLHAFVVMPNHVHLAVTPAADQELEDLLQSWKGFTSKQINAHLNRQGTLWQSESYDRIIRDIDHFIRVVRYIALNPRKAHLAPERYSMWLGCGRLLETGQDDTKLNEEASEYQIHSVW